MDLAAIPGRGVRVPWSRLGEILAALAEIGRPLTVVDLYDAPGQPAVLPCRMVGTLAANLEIDNMDFHEFVAVEGTEPWWEGS